MSSSFCNKPRPASSRIACGSVLMPTPGSGSVPADSNNSHPMPRARSISAVVRPPIPPPTIIAFIALLHSHQNAPRRPVTSHSGSLSRKRLCRLRLQFGAGLRLSLNFQIVEILPVPHAVAENLLLAGQIGRRAENLFGAVPGRGLHRARRINQMWTPERHQGGPARRVGGIDL